MKRILLHFSFAIMALLTMASYAQTSTLYNSPIESTSDSPVWYFIRSGDNNVLELPSSGTTINSVATPLTQNTDGMFWRFEKVSEGVFRMINKGRSGSIASDLSWDNAGDLSVTIEAISSTSTWSIKNGSNYFTQTTAGGVAATTTAPTSGTTASQFIFVKAPIAGNESSNLYYQLRSKRSTVTTILRVTSGTVAWYTTNNTNLDEQLFQFKRGLETNYFILKNRSNTALNITAPNTGVSMTASEANTPTQFFFNPYANGYAAILVKGWAATTTIDFNGGAGPTGTCGFYTNRTTALQIENGSFQFTEKFMPAYSGSALHLNGSTNFMRIPHHDDFNFSNTDDFSISFWINSNLVGGRNARMVAKRGPNETATTDKSGYELWGLNSTSNFYAVNTTTGTSNNNLYSVWGTIAGVASTWTHIAYVVTGTGSDRNIIMYQNGQVAGSAKISNRDISTFSVTNPYDVFIGKGQYDNGSGKVNGKIDNLRFWSKALSPEEVESDQAINVNASTPGLIAAYDFETVDLNTMTVADITSTHTAYLEDYTALTVTNLQQFGMTGRGNANDPILRATLSVSGTDPVGQPLSALTLSSAILNLAGTTNLSDITSLKVYSTGTNVNFDPRDPIGKGALLLGTCSPAAGDISCTLSGTLAAGTNYLWVTADIAENAAEGNQIDIALKNITSNGTTHTLSSNNPVGTTNIMLARKLIVAPGDNNSTHYRIPAMITADDGSVVLFTDKRKNNNSDLPQDIDIVVHRSTDNGKTWSAPTTIAQGTGFKQGFGDVATVKTKTGKIIAIFAAGNGFAASTVADPIKVYKSESTDNGINWTTPTDITSQFYGTGCPNPTRAAWSAMFISSGRMLYTSTGRIMAVALARDGSGAANYPNFVVYSDDDGETWEVSMSRVMQGGDEAKIMELADGSFMVTSRKGGAAGRLKATSADGLTWTDTSSNISELVEPGCNGDFIRYSQLSNGAQSNILLHSIPNNSSSRRNVSVFYSTDEGTSWTHGKSIVPVMANNGLSGYSSLTVQQDGTIGAYVEVENYSGIYNLVYMNFSLNWLTGGNQTYTENRWTGTISSDYSTASNWSTGVVPTGTPNITLARNAANPLILTGTHTLGTITINPGARLTIENGSNVTASTINIISDGTGIGTVIDNSGATNREATVSIQLTGRSGPTTNDQWWYIATPVNGATSNVVRNDASNLFGYYDEASVTYPQITNTSTALLPGQGYLVKLGGGNAYYSFPGTLNNGDVSINLTRTGTSHAKRGFNLIGNPYPSFVNWNTLLGERTDIRPTIWYRTRTRGGEMAFDTWNGLIGTGTGRNGNVTQYIPPMQAFWVKVDQDGTTGTPVVNTIPFTFTNASRMHRQGNNNSVTLLRIPHQQQVIRLQISNGTNHDETILMSYASASDGLDRYDAEKMANNNTAIPEIFTLLGTQEFAINTMNQLPLNKLLGIGFRPGKAGNFSLRASEVILSGEIEVVLHDLVTGTIIKLDEQNSYSFESDGTATNERFGIELRAPGTATGMHDVVPTIEIRSNNGKVILAGLSKGDTVHIYNTTGQLLTTDTAISDYVEVRRTLLPGIYLVKVNQKTIKINVQ